MPRELEMERRGERENERRKESQRVSRRRSRSRSRDRDAKGRQEQDGSNVRLKTSSSHRDYEGRRDESRRDRDPDRDATSKISTSSSSRPRHEKKSKKKKSKKKRRSSSSSSNTSTDSIQLLLKLEEERKRQLEETKKRKEVMKALETPEEKRIRRLAKKEEKEKKRKERMGWDNEYLHYTNTDNPFGDHSLLDTFMWKKKLEKDGMKDIAQEDLERINRLKQEENKRELEKVKKRRLEREREKQERDDEEALLQRQKEAAQFKEWGMSEDMFHLEQATLRSKIRIKDGRAKPIDLLAQYISAEEELDAIEMHEPYTYLNGLTVSDLEDLIEDIKVYEQLEKGKNLSYWNDITVIVEDELRKLRKLEQDDDYRVALERREGINPSVAQDVAAIFKGKSAEQLQALKFQIQSKLDGSTSGVDISYWESLLSQLKAHIARAQLRDRHQDNLKKKLALLKAEQGVEPGGSEEEEGIESPKPGTSTATATISTLSQVPAPDEASQDSTASKASASHSSAEEEVEEDETKDVIDECVTKYDQGSYSPSLITQDEIEPGIFVIGEEEDNARLDLARNQVLNVGAKVENVWTAEEKALQQEAKKGMGNDEATFAVETPLDQLYLWSDKYRPRKPRYFNRVHTGFEWNKYNQTHYDMDNPPPKIVQGYKFNIFFPDLIDKNTTPQYFLTACSDNPDFATLRFHAGPPYEDIAFKIVNREWEYSYKRGFRCQFHNNIFQLWFHFKRYRYRR